MSRINIYQVLPRLWKNGKFSDWNAESFDYLKSLGIDYIWYTGVIRHARGEDWVKGDIGSPYAISDYFDVNPYLADNEEKRMLEFEQLLSRTHASGFKALIDFVPNHVARCGASGIPTFPYCDYDWTDTLKIDYSAPGCWDKMYEVVRFWALKGVDGMRCDMVELVPPDFLKWLIAKIKEEFPDFLFIGEVYNKLNYQRFVSELGFDLLYDKSGLYDSLRAVLCGGLSARSITWNWQSLGGLQSKMLNFLENHDEQRVASVQFAAAPRRAFSALAVNALFNDASFMLYFGQECGERALDGVDGRTSIFSKANVKSLDKPDAYVLERYRDLMKTSCTPLFRKGRNWDICYCNAGSPGFNPDRHFAFLRILEKEAALVVCNFSDVQARMSLRIPPECGIESPDVDIDVPSWDFTKIELSL